MSCVGTELSRELAPCRTNAKIGETRALKTRLIAQYAILAGPNLDFDCAFGVLQFLASGCPYLCAYGGNGRVNY